MSPGTIHPCPLRIGFPRVSGDEPSTQAYADKTV